jgi:UDP-glucose 4-epimerase
MKNVFISGGAGFIGSHLCDRLVHRPIDRVTVYDNFSSGNRAHEALLRKMGVNLIEADIANMEELSRAMAGSDVVFQLAANPDIAKAVTQPDIDFWQGTLLAQNVFEAARRNGIQKIIYFSGSGVYGDRGTREFAEDYGPMEPISTYGASKLGCEALLCAYCHMFGVKGRAFRFANVVGPRQTHGVGYDFLRRLKMDPTRLRILGDGTQSKSYIHVDDVLDAVLRVADRCDSSYEVYNVATGDYITVNDIATMAVEIAGLPRGSVKFEHTGGDRGWKGDVPVVRFNCAKIMETGWRCRRTARQAIYDSMAAMWSEL